MTGTFATGLVQSSLGSAPFNECFISCVAGQSSIRAHGLLHPHYGDVGGGGVVDRQYKWSRHGNLWPARTCRSIGGHSGIESLVAQLPTCLQYASLLMHALFSKGGAAGWAGATRLCHLHPQSWDAWLHLTLKYTETSIVHASTRYLFVTTLIKCAVGCRGCATNVGLLQGWHLQDHLQQRVVANALGITGGGSVDVTKMTLRH